MSDLDRSKSINSKPLKMFTVERSKISILREHFAKCKLSLSPWPWICPLDYMKLLPNKPWIRLMTCNYCQEPLNLNFCQEPTYDF